MRMAFHSLAQQQQNCKKPSKSLCDMIMIRTRCRERKRLRERRRLRRKRCMTGRCRKKWNLTESRVLYFAMPM